VKLHSSSAIRVFVLAGFLACLACTAAVSRGATLIVSNSATPCAGATFTQIQAAISVASPGDTIVVCNGTYPEQLSITISLDIEADSGAFLVPASIPQNTTSLATGDGIAAAVLVSGATNVTISGLTVDGINNGITECAPRLIGVYFQNSSGTLRHAAIRNFKLSADLNGCQSGTAVFVESGGGKSSNVEIADCSIHDFQKNGVTANEAGTTARIHDNVVTGLGPTAGATQNGIQIGFSAAGTIRENTVANLIWSPCTDVTTCMNVAAAILVTESNGVRVLDNTVGVTQVGVFIDGNNATVSDNTAYSASIFDNIFLMGNANQVSDNRLVNGGQADVFIQGNNNSITGNSISEAPAGVLVATGSTGNTFSANRFFNVGARIQDPAVTSASKLPVPDR
jgi:nitrous oxidase accessory protein NosD